MKKLIYVTAFALSPLVASAQEASLYAAPPPADAAFVRFLNHPIGSVTWHGLDFQITEDTENKYFIIHSSDAEVGTGDFINVLSEEIYLIEPEKNNGKAAIGLISHYPEEVSLMSADGALEIIGSVVSSGDGWREVNPVSVSVAVFSGGSAMSSPIDLSLIRGESTTIYVDIDGNVFEIPTGFNENVIE